MYIFNKGQKCVNIGQCRFFFTVRRIKNEQAELKEFYGVPHSIT